MEEAVKTARIFVTATGCSSIICAEHFDAMLEDAIVCNIGHFDCEIDVDYLNNNCVHKDLVQPQVSLPPLTQGSGSQCRVCARAYRGLTGGRSLV